MCKHPQEKMALHTGEQWPKILRLIFNQEYSQKAMKRSQVGKGVEEEYS